jgi:UDP:flavonoid glycosyltransferase YjiC (YdhE family)
VLLSFGGIGLEIERAPAVRGVSFVSTGGAAAGGAGTRGCRSLTHAEMTAAGVRYEDLVGACDAVMTKPGYGIVAECIANGTPIVYTARGRFAEYACLVAGIEAHLPNAFIANDDLRRGRWGAALEAVLDQPRRAAAARIDGAEQAATVLSSLAGGVAP